MGKKGSFGARTASWLFAVVAFVTGFLLIDRGSISGNVVVTSEPSVGAVSVIGLLLVLVAAALTAYGLRK